MATLPTGICYPPASLPASFSRNIQITLGIFLQRSSYKQYTNECYPEQNDSGWVLVKQYPWYRAGSTSFNFTLNFNLNPNFQQGDNPDTYYVCMNINAYTQAFQQKVQEATQEGITLADNEERDMPDTTNTCTKCENGETINGSTVRKQKVTCISNVEVVQVIAPGCI